MLPCPGLNSNIWRTAAVQKSATKNRCTIAGTSTIIAQTHKKWEVGVRNFFNPVVSRFSAFFLLAATLSIFSGCSGGGGSSTSGTGGTTTPTASSISLATSATSVKSDSSNSATITVTALDSSNAVVSGQLITLQASTGQLSTASATTGADGKITATFTSGTIDSSNRTATITATISGTSTTATIPVLISGSTLTLTPSAGSVQVGAGTITLTATTKDAGGTGKYGQTVRFSIDATSTGAATLSATTLTTGVTGTTGNVTLTPTSAGTVVVAAEWLDSSGAVSVKATQNIDVTAAAGISFAITTPATDPLSLATSGTQALAVSVPSTIGGTAVASVRISSTAGTWTGAAPAAGPSPSIVQTPAANAVAATYTAPGNSGAVTIQVDALSAASAVLSTLTRTFVVSAPSADAASLNLQASVSTIAPSSGSNSSTATLTATVRDSSDNSVGNAAVLFQLLGTTGSGESISPTVSYTDGTGKAAATFSAGSLSTLGPIYAQASVVGQVCTGSSSATPPYSDEANPLCDSTPLIVSSTSVSVVIGTGTTVSDSADKTQYLLPGSLLVVDANGSPVANATVTLTVFPIEYRNGSITDGGSGCLAPATSFTANEDVNRNGILDPGEDTNSNGKISPPQAAGGAIPTPVTTDSSGAATFTLQYPKSSAWFITDELTARVTVAGTESSAQTIFELPMSSTDAKATPCSLARTATY
jgi:Bacterial Ig-like domain (group 1)